MKNYEALYRQIAGTVKEIAGRNFKKAYFESGEFYPDDLAIEVEYAMMGLILKVDEICRTEGLAFFIHTQKGNPYVKFIIYQP